MKWWMKASAQAMLARIPKGELVHEWLQTRWGELARLESTSRFSNAVFYLRTVHDRVGLSNPIRAVEIGTGWVPAVPIALLLAGVQVDSFDIVRLMRPTILQRCLREIERHLPRFAEAAGLPVQAVQRRYDLIRHETEFECVAGRLGGLYRAPWDTTRLPYRDGQVDLAFSNLVFQNVHVCVLERLVQETFRILKPGGFAIHRIGMDDEYAAVDPARGPLDFLRYSRSGWDLLFSHSIKYCNRIRCSQFLELFSRTGFREVWTRKRVDYEAIGSLRRRGVAPEFRRMSWEDLATTGLDIVLEKPSDRSTPRSRPTIKSKQTRLATSVA